MTDAEDVRSAAAFVGSSFIFGFAGFSFAFASAMGDYGAAGAGVVLLAVAVGMMDKVEWGSDSTPEPARPDPEPATDGGHWEVDP